MRYQRVTTIFLAFIFGIIFSASAQEKAVDSASGIVVQQVVEVLENSNAVLLENNIEDTLKEEIIPVSIDTIQTEAMEAALDAINEVLGEDGAMVQDALDKVEDVIQGGVAPVIVVEEEPAPPVVAEIAGESEPAREEKETVAAERESAESAEEQDSSAGSVVDETATSKPKAKKFFIEALDFRETDILEVLKTIEDKTGLKIEADDNIRGLVTICLRDVEVWDALRIITETHNLAYFRDEDKVSVMTDDEFFGKYSYEFAGKVQTRIVPVKHVDLEEMISNLIALKSKEGKFFIESKAQALILMDAPENLAKMEQLVEDTDIPLETEIFQLRYAQVQKVKEKIDPLLTKNVGRLEYDKRSNQIVITDTALKIREIADIIQDLDKKIEISVETQIIQILLVEEHQDGIDWEAIVSDYQSFDLFSEKKNVQLEGSTLKIGTLTNEDYGVLLEAIETVGKVTTLAKSQVNVIVNQEAKIALGVNVPSYGKTNPASRLTDNPAQDISDIQIKIKPEVEEDSLVINLEPKLSWSWVPYVMQAARTAAKETYTSNSIIAAKVNDDEVMVIGGLFREHEVSKTKKFPLLGDLPILGFAFRRHNKLIEKTEYIIFLTHKIIEEKAAGE